MPRYVVVTGGVVSGLGKGVTASSIGALMKGAGWTVTALKIDPYLNVDAGTMSPYEHGEVFVLDDGGEADLDLGNYERYMDINLGRDNNLTTGKVYQHVIEKERRGDYLGKTVQVVPHITDAIQDWIERVARTPVDESGKEPDLCIIELGGTVGDIESMPFIEALRQFQFRVGPENFCVAHVSLVPVLGVVGEQKTKPTQHTVQTVRSLGLSPDFLVCRSSALLEDATKSKLSLFCQVPKERIVAMHDVSNLYYIPCMLRDQGVDVELCRRLGLAHTMPTLTLWERLSSSFDTSTEVTRIALVGKYTGLSDSYLSVIKSLQHAALAVRRRLEIEWIEANELVTPGDGAPPSPGAAFVENPEAVHQATWARLRGADAVLIPGGFGSRGVEGMIAAVKYAREAKVPFLGICLGMQVAVIEYARNVLGLEGAHSAEFDSATPDPVIVFMPEGSRTQLGGTMRLGTRKTVLQTTECIAAKLYQTDKFIDERHRHRYEVNPALVPDLEKAGLAFVGKDETNRRMEIVEIQSHPFFFAAQYHPEFKSRPGRPSPPFLGLMLAASGKLNAYLGGPRVATPTPLDPL